MPQGFGLTIASRAPYASPHVCHEVVTHSFWQCSVLSSSVPGLHVVEKDDPSGGHSGLEVLEKFDDKPKTAEIRKACERELTCVEIAKVKISNKLLNFGEVCDRREPH